MLSAGGSAVIKAELDATVLTQAEAEKQRSVIVAEGTRQATIITAEGNQRKLVIEAEGAALRGLNPRGSGDKHQPPQLIRPSGPFKFYTE